jgi:hypothetical protein
MTEHNWFCSDNGRIPPKCCVREPSHTVAVPQCRDVMTQSPKPQEGSHWRIWKAIASLERLHAENSRGQQVGQGPQTTKGFGFSSFSTSIVSILKLWASAWAGLPAWQSLLNKTSFLDEVEESMVALFYLDEWRRSCPHCTYVAVDVCGGKGIFSMLLQYMEALYWNTGGQSSRCKLQKIVLLEKATSATIDWSHLMSPTSALPVVSSATANLRNLVPIEIWQDCNLKNIDDVVGRMESLHPHVLALTGIHLCKLLSPALVGIVNKLGPKRCVYLCLAPCCMPRIVTAKNIAPTDRCLYVCCYENDEKRRQRRQNNERYEAKRRKNRSIGVCFLCDSKDHWLRQCPTLPPDKQAQSCLLQAAAAATPCWNCGLVGHFQSECNLDHLKRLEPPMMQIDVSAVLESNNPIFFYSKVLANGLDDQYIFNVYQAALTARASRHQEQNWNSSRKTVFIVAHSKT